NLCFFIDADCVHCAECRREFRANRRRLSRYSILQSKPSLTFAELESLVDDASYLFARGLLRNLSNLGRLKNQALRMIPEYPGTAILRESIAKARARSR